MEQQVLTVSQLTRQIKEVLDKSFPRLWVEAEISNFTHHSSGHMYFTLKDENAQIRCAMWRFRAGALLFRPQNGMQVLIEGDVQVYERGGNYQLIVNQMQPAGVGSLQLAFEQLKQKLHKEGLFDEQHKKSLPRFPQRIGVITSPTGAAIRDIITVLGRRFPAAEIVLHPVRVQGEGAAAEIVAAIDVLNRESSIDVLIVGRGGGSLEDLWAFNEEVVARAIFSSEIPVISAVGHEVDFTIADFVADRRAATPSAAAEIAVPDQSELAGQLRYYEDLYSRVVRKQHEFRINRLQALVESYAFRRPLDRIYQFQQRLDELGRQYTTAMLNRTKLAHTKLSHYQQQFEAVHPEHILRRGYSICYHEGDIVRDVSVLNKEDKVNVKLANGSFDAVVESRGEES